MGYRIFLIIQIFFLTLYIIGKVFDLDGVFVVLTYLASWIFAFFFYFRKSFITLFKRQYWLSSIYLLFTLLIAYIPIKIWFVFHNVIVHFVLILGFLLLLYRRRELKLNKYFKIHISLSIFINIILFFTNDNFIDEKITPNYLLKPYSSEHLNWSHFNKVDSLKGGYDAHIETYISYKINRVFNYTSATAVAITKLDESHFVSQSDNLLKHELYHFKITEIVTRKLNKILDNHHFSSPSNTKKIILQYLDTLRNMQNTYDAETKHNLNPQKQKQWELWVDKELKN